MVLPPINEKQFEVQIKGLCKFLQVGKYYHPFLSKWSERGFPDLTIVKPPKLIFAELKSEKGKVSVYQQEWIDLLNQCTSVEAHIWRPSDLEPNGGVIADILRGGR